MRFSLTTCASLCLTLHFVLLSPASGQSPRETESAISRAEAQKLYAEATDSLAAYDRAHEGWIETPNIRMRYLEWTNPGGIPFVWIPGTFETAYRVSPVIDELVEMGLHVFAVEYYGHGKTSIPEHPVSNKHVADDIITLLDSRGIDRAIIAGFSRGGWIAGALYDEYPERALGLVLADGGSYSLIEAYDKSSDEELRQVFEGFDITADPELGLVSYPTDFELFYEVVKDRTDRSHESLFELLTQMSQESDGRWRLNSGLTEWLGEDTLERLLELLRRPSLGTLFQQSVFSTRPLAIFRNLDVPTLIIDTVEDPFPATDQNQALQQLHPDLIDHQVWSNTTHTGFYGHPERLLRDLSALITRIKDSSSRIGGSGR